VILRLFQSVPESPFLFVETAMVLVNGKSYSVTEKAGYIKAELSGIFGWTSVWAPTEGLLQRRIATVLSEGAFGARQWQSQRTAS
jgi:hypothetical protein